MASAEPNDPSSRPEPKVHPSALVPDTVKLAPGVEIGPFCSLEGDITLNPGVKLLGSNFLRGPMTIGQDTVIYPHASLGYAPQDRKFPPDHEGAGIAIGQRNIIREGVTVHRATADHPTTVGDDNYLMANAHLGHDVLLGNHTMLANGTLLGGHVQVGDGAVLGGNSTLHQFVRMGRLAILSGLAGVTQDIPPFCMIRNTRVMGSLNIVGLRRAGYQQDIPALKQAFRLLFREGLSKPHAVERIRAELGDNERCIEMADFIDEGKRGIVTWAPDWAVPKNIVKGTGESS